MAAPSRALFLGRRLRLLPKIFLPPADRFCSLVIYVEEGFAFSHTLIHQRIAYTGLRGISYVNIINYLKSN